MMNWKRFVMTRSWPNLSCYPVMSLEKLRQAKKHSQHSRSLSHDLNPGPPERETGVLTTRLRRALSESRYVFVVILSPSSTVP
jgi:hypothetical protein